MMKSWRVAVEVLLLLRSISFKTIFVLFGCLCLSYSLPISQFRNNSRPCDYLIITPADFSSQADRLAQYRNESMGDDVSNALVAILDTIYKEFPRCDTCFSWHQIQDATRWAYENWPGDLQYVVLLGDDVVK